MDKFPKVRNQKLFGCRTCRFEGCFICFPEQEAWINMRTHEIFCYEHKDRYCVPLLVKEDVK